MDFEHYLFLLAELKNLMPCFILHVLFYTILISGVHNCSEHNYTINIYYDDYDYEIMLEEYNVIK